MTESANAPEPTVSSGLVDPEAASMPKEEDPVELPGKAPPKINLFQKLLTVWVLLAMGLGIIIGYFAPVVADGLNSANVAGVNIPIAVLLWGIILPMMLQIDFASIVNAVKQPKGILMTTVLNYAVQPFTMYGIAVLFFNVVFINYLGQEKASQYIIGSVLLGAAPCTAMVFVWSTLMNGNAAYTLTQVAVNDILLLILYSPTVKLLAGAANIEMPWSTLFASVGFFVLIPLAIGVVTRLIVSRRESWLLFLNTRIIPFMDSCSMVFLLLMIVLLFICQASTIVHNFVDILIIAVPLLIQTFLIWGIAYVLSLLLRLPYDVAGPAMLIAASNFFEMAVAIAISLYGASSGAALATVVGVIIEVPVMLTLVWINNKTQHLFKGPSKGDEEVEDKAQDKVSEGDAEANGKAQGHVSEDA
jgi:ACR3 family arsenite transporter